MIFAIFGPIWTQFRSKQLKIWPGSHFWSNRLDPIAPIDPIDPIKAIHPIAPIDPIKAIHPIAPIDPIKAIRSIRSIRLIQLIWLSQFDQFINLSIRSQSLSEIYSKHVNLSILRKHVITRSTRSNELYVDTFWRGL